MAANTVIHAALSEDLPLPAQAIVAKEAERLGFAGFWTPENRQRDGFVACTVWGLATTRLQVGIGVSPIGTRHPHALAMAALSVQEATGGRFVLGLGAGSRDGTRRNLGVDPGPPLAAMTDYLRTVRGLMAGEHVTYQGRTLKLADDVVELTPRPRPAPLFLAALGQKMLALGGAEADGVLLNWTDERRVALAKSVIAEGAAAAGRDPKSVIVAGYIRVCVDPDRDKARRAIAAQAIRYILAPHYRAQFAEMGFGPGAEAVVEAFRSGGLTSAVSAMPSEFVDAIGAYGSADVVRARFAELSKGLDVPIVRIVPSETGLSSITDVLRATAPL